MCRAGGPHHFTLLDGEMVVDEDVVADRRERRYLAYDLVMLNGKSLMDQPFKACRPMSLLRGDFLHLQEMRKGVIWSALPLLLHA